MNRMEEILDNKLPQQMFFGMSFSDPDTKQIRFLLEHNVIKTLNELFWLLSTKYKNIIDGSIHKEGKSKDKYESLKIISKLSDTTALNETQINEIKKAISIYNNCFPRWFFIFGKEKPNDLPRAVKKNSAGKDVYYNEMYANFVASNNFISINGLLMKIIIYSACRCFPGLESYSHRIIGMASQRTLVATNTRNGIDYRYFREGFCVRFWFDHDITEDEMMKISNLFKKNFISCYSATLINPDIELISCGIFRMK